MARRTHSDTALSRRPRYQPKHVSDLDALAAALDEFIETEGRAEFTRGNDARNWERWKRHCEDVAARRGMPVDPLDAPFGVFEDLLLESRRDGLPLAVGTVGCILSAVLWRYRQAGRMPAHKRPEHRDHWKQLLKGMQKKEAARREAGDAPREDVTPLLRAEVAQMLAAKPPSDHVVDAKRATLLLAFDTDLNAPRLAALEAEEIGRLADGGITVPGWRGTTVELPCNHAEPVEGVPWDCTACAVRAVIAGHSGTGPLLSAATSSMNTFLYHRRQRWPGLQTAGKRCGSALEPVPGLDAWGLAGLRRGLMLTAANRGYRWARARAWTALSWTCGLRMASDVLGLDRRSITPDPAGRGYRIHLGRTKDDPYGTKGVARPLSSGLPGGPSVAQAVAEYLCIRDAAAGPRGGLILGSPEWRYAPIKRGMEGSRVAKDDLDLLCEVAGLPAVYTSYSTRKGYARQAELDGWPVEDIKEGLRHQLLHTTLAHYAGAADPKRAVNKLMASGDAP